MRILAIVATTAIATAIGYIFGQPMLGLVGLAMGVFITLCRNEIRNTWDQYAVIGTVFFVGLNIAALPIGISIPPVSPLLIAVLFGTGALSGIAYRFVVNLK